MKISRTNGLGIVLFITILLATYLFYNNIELNEKLTSIDSGNLIFKNFEYQGNLDAETVIIYCQGGPSTALKHNELPFEFVKSAPGEKLKNALVVYMHQAQTANPSLITEKEISFEKAKEYDRNTTNMLSHVVNYFSAKGKEVYLVGTSFGALVVQDYLALFSSKLISGAVICVGRLDMQDEFWKAFSEGKEYFFKDGITPLQVEEKDRKMNGDTYITSLNIPKLAAGLGYKRYTQLLANVDLSNTIYIFGIKDVDVGRLTQDEIQFLENKKVKIYQSELGHQEATVEYLGKAILEIVSK